LYIFQLDTVACGVRCAASESPGLGRSRRQLREILFSGIRGAAGAFGRHQHTLGIHLFLETVECGLAGLGGTGGPVGGMCPRMMRGDLTT
jgi:hypothetical protein